LYYYPGKLNFFCSFFVSLPSRACQRSDVSQLHNVQFNLQDFISSVGAEKTAMLEAFEILQNFNNAQLTKWMYG